MKPSHSTLASSLYRTLQERIVSGRVRARTRLVERGLCREFGVSRAVVRESLIRLAHSGLVHVIPDAGATVTELSESKIMDAYLFREAIESAAAEQCASRMNREQINELLELAGRFQTEYRASCAGKPHQLQGLEQAFHGAIIRGSGNEFLQRGWEIARLHLYRGTRRHPEDAMSEKARKATVDDHLAIAEAIRDGKAEKAGQTMKQHIRHGRELVLQQMRGHGVASISTNQHKPSKNKHP